MSRPLRQSTAAIRVFGGYSDTNGASVRSLTNIAGVIVNNGVTAAATITLTNVASAYVGLIPASNIANAGELSFIPNTNAAFVAPRVEHWAVEPTGIFDLDHGTNGTFTGGLMDVGRIGSIANNVITASSIASGALSGKGDWVQVRHATISADSTGANPTVISYLMVADNYISNVLVAGEFTSGDGAGVPFIGFADTFSTITLSYQFPTAFAIGDTFNLWVLGGPKVDPVTGVAVGVTVGALNTAGKADVLNALTGGTNTVAVDSSHRVSVNLSGGTVSLSTADEALLANLTSMTTGSGTNAKFTTTALSNVTGGTTIHHNETIIEGNETISP